MKEIKLAGHKVVMYNSIEDLPIKRFHKFNKCMLVDAGIGSDLTAFDAHIERVVRYIRTEKKEDAAREMENMRQNLYLVMEGINPQQMAFACLVHSIDGKCYDDMSDDGLRNVLHLLGGAPAKDVASSTDEAKKKIDAELNLYFPKIFDDSRTKEYYDLLKARAKAMLDCILNGDTDEQKQRVEDMTDRLMTFNKPKNFSGADSIEIEFDKQFETMCLMISENLHTDAKKMTVMEYYNAYNYINKQLNARKTQNKTF